MKVLRVRFSYIKHSCCFSNGFVVVTSSVRVRKAWVSSVAEVRGRDGMKWRAEWIGWGWFGGGGILNQRSAPVTPSGVPPSGHVPKIATGAVSSAKPPASGLQPACECEISMGIVGHLPMSAFFPSSSSLPFFSLLRCDWQMSLHFWASTWAPREWPVCKHSPSHKHNHRRLHSYLLARLAVFVSQPARLNNNTTWHQSRCPAPIISTASVDDLLQIFFFPPTFPPTLFASHTNGVLLAKMDHYQHYRCDVEYF